MSTEAERVMGTEAERVMGTEVERVMDTGAERVMDTEAMAIASGLYADLEKAWNRSDGAGYGESFGDGSDFVDIRGVHHFGDGEKIGAEHQGIFDTIYRDSIVRYEVEDARAVAPGVVVAHARATLEVPGGPFAGVRQAVSTVVIVATDEGWRATAFHNTLVTG
jgi:uncharacterized protein (TIGR02246 family)